MKVRKEIIRPGTYTYIHPKTGLPAKLIVTPERVKYFHDQGNAMLAAGLSVPVPMEHVFDAKPMTAEDRAANRLRNNAGWVEKYEVEPGDKLFGVLDIKDDDIAKKIGNETIKWVSPWINSYLDGAGKSWDGVVSHVALTSTPRITEQVPFAGMAAALSLVNQLSDQPFTAAKIADGGICLSLAGLVTKDAAGSYEPKFPRAFSKMMGIKLSSDEMATIKKKKIVDSDGDGDGDEVAEDTDGDGIFEGDGEGDGEGKGRVSPLDAVPEPTSNTGNDLKGHEAVCHLLKALGFSPPEGMDESTFVRDIYETLMAKVQEEMAKAKADKEQPVVDPLAGDDDDDNSPTNPVLQESPSMYASLEEVNKIADPKERKLAGIIFSLSQSNARAQKRADAAAASILGEARKKRDQKVEKLAKRLPLSKADRLRTMMAAPNAALSLDDSGQVKDPMADVLDMFDAVALDMTQTLASAKQHDHPADGSFSTERAKQVVETMLANTGGVPAVAKS